MFFVAIGFGVYAWYSLNAGIVKICGKGTASCLEFKITEHEGEFYASLTVIILISLVSLIYGIKLIVNKNKNA